MSDQHFVSLTADMWFMGSLVIFAFAKTGRQWFIGWLMLVVAIVAAGKALS